MKPKQLKKLTEEKLIEKLQTSRKELLDLRFDLKTGESKDYSEVNKKKKEIARILTIFQEKSFSNEKEVVAENKDTKKNKKNKIAKKDK